MTVHIDDHVDPVSGAACPACGSSEVRWMAQLGAIHGSNSCGEQSRRYCMPHCLHVAH